MLEAWQVIVGTHPGRICKPRAAVRALPTSTASTTGVASREGSANSAGLFIPASGGARAAADTRASWRGPGSTEQIWWGGMTLPSDVAQNWNVIK